MAGNDSEWLKEEVDADGTIFDVRQRRLEPLRNSAFALGGSIICALIVTSIFSGGQPSTGAGIFALFLILLGFVCFVIGILGGIAAIIISLTTKPTVKVSVKSDTLSILDGSNLSPLNAMSYENISKIYVMNSKKTVTSSTTSEMTGEGAIGMTVAAAANTAQKTGQAVGQGLVEVLNTNSAKIAVNFRGKEVIIVKRLSDDEADYLFQKITSLAGYR